MKLFEYGLYNVKDSYFNDFKNDYLVDNKQENRPYYFCLKDSEGIMWFIPLSTQVESYKAKIAKDKKKYRHCLFYHIGVINGIERVFLIGNMFPITKKYVKKAFTINGLPYIVADSNLIKKINNKATRYLVLVENRKLKPQVDILKIKNSLIKTNKNSSHIKNK